MEITAEAKKAEAIRRLKELVEKTGLNPNVVKYLEDDRLYYSYLTAGGMMGSIDTINYDKRYAKKVEWFENFFDAYVYHVIETANSLAFLFVSDEETQWETERLSNNGVIMAYVCFPDEMGCDEFGDIRIMSYQGALVRIE